MLSMVFSAHEIATATVTLPTNPMAAATAAATTVAVIDDDEDAVSETEAAWMPTSGAVPASGPSRLPSPEMDALTSWRMVLSATDPAPATARAANPAARATDTVTTVARMAPVAVALRTRAPAASMLVSSTVAQVRAPVGVPPTSFQVWVSS